MGDANNSGMGTTKSESTSSADTGAKGITLGSAAGVHSGSSALASNRRSRKSYPPTTREGGFLIWDQFAAAREVGESLVLPAKFGISAKILPSETWRIERSQVLVGFRRAPI